MMKVNEIVLIPGRTLNGDDVGNTRMITYIYHDLYRR